MPDMAGSEPATDQRLTLSTDAGTPLSDQRATSRPDTGAKGTDDRAVLGRLSTFDESTWKGIQDTKEQSATRRALHALAQALRQFVEAQPGGKWREPRLAFERFISDPKYEADYIAAYDRAVRAGIRQALGQTATQLAKDLSLVVPNFRDLAAIYYAPEGTRPTDEQLRSALSPGYSAAADFWGSPSRSGMSPQSREDLLKNTWFSTAVAAGRLLDEIERQGLLTTIDITAADFLKGLGRLGDKWVDGFLALNGRAAEQGEYAGRMVGGAIAQVIWAAANFVAFEAASRAFTLTSESLAALHERVLRLTIKQRIARWAARTKAALEWIEKALAKDIPQIFYRVFVETDGRAFERLLQGAAELKGGTFVNRARKLKGTFLFEELIPFNARYAGRVAEIEDFLAHTPSGVWHPKVYRARRIWVWQYNSYERAFAWTELGDGGLVVFPKPGVKSRHKMGLANLFESKSAGVVEKAAASPEFIAGQVGKDFERLDFADPAYGGAPAIRVEVEGLGAGASDTTIVELKADELFYSRKPPTIEKTPTGEVRSFGTYWTVVAPPDSVPATLARTSDKLQAAGFGKGEVWLHPMNDSTAQRIAEFILEFVERAMR
jgi:hypothetical protein